MPFLYSWPSQILSDDFHVCRHLVVVLLIEFGTRRDITADFDDGTVRIKEKRKFLPVPFRV